MRKTNFLFFFLLISLGLSLNSLSNEKTKVSDLDPKDICQALGRTDCNKTDAYSFISQMKKYINASDKHCFAFSVSRDKSTKNITNTSFYIKYQGGGWNNSCKQNQLQALGKCNRDANEDEECIILFNENKVMIPNFLSQINNSSENLQTNNNINSKLKKIKSLLNEGLITEEQYVEMSSKILENF
jgi:hypothetical protein